MTGTKRPLEDTKSAGGNPLFGDREPADFIALPFYGEHKKAVSACSFAPTRAQRPFGSTSYATGDAPALCASASADGTVKLWKLSAEMLEEGAVGTEALLAAQAAEDAAAQAAMAEGAAAPSSPAASQQQQKNYLPKPGPLHALQTLQGHARGINDVAWSPTAEYLATASDDKSLRVWDAETGDALVEFRGHTNFVFSCAFNPQSNLLVSGSFDETVKIWDVRSGDCVSTLPAHSDPVTGVDFNRDGTCIVSGSHDGLIRIWDTMTGECLKTIYAGGNPPVSFVRFSPNGKFVLSGTLDSTLRLWRVGDRESAVDAATAALAGGPVGGASALGGGGARCTKTYTGGHQNSKFCIFSTFAVANPRRQSVVTGSEDGSVYVYDLQKRNVRQVLRAHKDAVLAVGAHDTRELLASGGMTEDKTVRFWVPAAPAPEARP
jgi:COMPASS component SWD3